MSSFKKYFSHHFRDTALRCIVIAVLALLLAVSFLDFHSYTEDNYYLKPSCSEGETCISATYVSGDITVLSIIAAISATVIPILELIGFRNRRNMDALLVLPISRIKMALVHYLNGLLQLVFVNGVCFLLATVIMIPYANVYPIWAMIPYFALLMLVSAAIYSIFFFIFMQGNTIADGVIFMIFYSVIGMLIVFAIDNLVDNMFDFREIDGYIEHCSPYSPIVSITNYFERFITPTLRYDATVGPTKIIQSYRGRYEWKLEHTISLVIWCVLGALSAVGYLYSFTKQRTERIGGISNSPFGYMTLIPICAFSNVIAGMNGFASSIIVMIAMIIGYIIYRRSIKLKVPDFICIGIFALLIISGIEF